MPASRMVSLFSPVNKQDIDMTTKKKMTTVGPCQFQLDYFEFPVISELKIISLGFSIDRVIYYWFF